MPALSVTPGRFSSCSSNGPHPSPHTPAPPPPHPVPDHTIGGGGGWERQTPDHICVVVLCASSFVCALIACALSVSLSLSLCFFLSFKVSSSVSHSPRLRSWRCWRPSQPAEQLCANRKTSSHAGLEHPSRLPTHGRRPLHVPGAGQPNAMS